VRSRRDQPLPARVDGSTEAFQRSRAEQRKVSGLREHDLVDGFEALGANDRIAGGAGDALAIRHHERKVLLGDTHACGAERDLGHPGELGARTDEDAVHHDRLLAPADVGGLAIDLKHTHQLASDVAAAGSRGNSGVGWLQQYGSPTIS
jgi:hypothetical protein